MKKSIRNKIKNEFKDCILRTIDRVKNSKGDYRPFHSRLLGGEILMKSIFERSFSTSFGQKVIETISNIIASGNNKTTDIKNQKKTVCKISKDTIFSIDEHLRFLREGKTSKAKWSIDLKSIKSSTKGIVEVRVISDLWFVRNGIEYFFSIKTVKPNIDQTEKVKRDMLLLKMFNQKYQPFFALPYNPYGEKKNDYRHNPSFTIFDMVNDEVVLIGREYWEMLGGRGTYKELLQIADEVGIELKSKLKIRLKK